MKIFIQQLEEGIHEFDEKSTSDQYDFLDNKSYPNPLLLKIVVDKINNLFRFKINIKTQAIGICDRCLSEFENKINMTIEQLYQIGYGDLNREDEVEILPEKTKEIDISKAIHDAFMMNRPIQLLCDKDCKGLCSNCGANLNQEKCKCLPPAVDPRLEKLKKLIK
jgi:uncharacterized protein